MVTSASKHRNEQAACAHAHPPEAAAALAAIRVGDGSLRLTPSRRAVFDALLGARGPLGAYDLIERLAGTDGRRPAPISVYRALDFLCQAGLVHRIESRNAYVACAARHGEAEPVVFLLCAACGCAAEVSGAALAPMLGTIAADAAFRPTTQVVEMVGRCGHCA